MKKTFQLLWICAALAVCALSAFANNTASQPILLQDQCTDENKTAWYTEFRGQLKADQAKANELAKKYLACPPSASDSQEAKDAEQKIVDYLKRFVAAYEKASGDTEKAKRKAAMNEAINKKDYPKAIDLAKQIIGDDPNYMLAYLNLSYAGFASANKAFANEAADYGKKAIQMIEGGNVPAEWKPSDKDEALAKLNYWVGSEKLEGTPGDTVSNWIKAASSDIFKKDPELYYRLGIAYEGPAQKQITDYNTTYNGKTETNESKLALENANQMIDRAIDAFARAVALAGSDPKKSAIKSDAMSRLTDWYKIRHDKSDAGLDKLIAEVLSKPLPPAPTPITTLPTPTATPGSTSGTGATAATGSGGSTAAKTTTTTTPPKNAPAPTKPTPGKPNRR